MPQSIFHTRNHKLIESRIKKFLNENQNILSKRTLASTRATGDAVEELIGDNFANLASEYCSDVSNDFARRSMADLAFVDKYNNYCIIDVKTHREDTKFNMPNLTSVKRLARLYEDDSNYFSLLFISYKIDKGLIKPKKIILKPIEFFDWECLTLGALGIGQIQIANAKNIIINEKSTRRKWMIEMCDQLIEFYPKEISKINERIDYFTKVRKFWIDKK